MKKSFWSRIVLFTCVLTLVLSFMMPCVSAGTEPYYPAYTGNSDSLVDALNSIGVNSSFSFREKIAIANGIDDYRGTAGQNITLLQKLRDGILIDPEAATGETLTSEVGGVTHGITVTKDKAPLRATPDGSAKVLYRAEKGAVLELLGTKRTGFLGFKKWYKVSYNNEVYYIYGENAEMHTHEYTSYTAADTRFKVCDCGHVVFTTYQTVETKRMEAYTALCTVAATTALADGPIPVGDVIGAVIVAAGTIYLLTEEEITTDTAQVIATDIDYIDYLKTVDNECSASTYRMVVRAPDNLKIIGDSCLNVGEAYVYVRYCSGDVWCTTASVAEAVGELHGSGYYIECDEGEPSHYKHIHLGANASLKVGGHIFFGANDWGQIPTP